MAAEDDIKEFFLPKDLNHFCLGCYSCVNWNMVKEDKKAKIEKDMAKLSKKIKCCKKPHVGIKTRFIFSIMAMMHKSGWDSSPVEKEYWDKRGWLKSRRPWKN